MRIYICLIHVFLCVVELIITCVYSQMFLIFITANAIDFDSASIYVVVTIANSNAK